MSTYKLVCLGETAVGKSSLCLQFARGQFNQYSESTIGASFLTQSVIVDGSTIKFEIWDTAGQERYHSLAPMVRIAAPFLGGREKRINSKN
mmetsp:Transcript_12041/g.19482  ORF Transcript_12041/g.19482 Transcript_12041/m.19482 type:complete len:91 (-) Transcript_12041:923-1195(-)